MKEGRSLPTTSKKAIQFLESGRSGQGPDIEIRTGESARERKTGERT